ncbi:MAG: 2,3-bisphosphoglycerate-independent phosphoglycerate mutase [Clostridia bacterium]|nr:2,3-bisphosphoglycerate-independent phosphoglycerate mutase [Clostridia bacterium]
MIMDGWGISNESAGNAVAQADTPNYDYLLRKYPWTTLMSSGGAVGLPEGQMGNSEVGHLNIGAGRVVYQDFSRIGKAVESGEFFENETLDKAVKAAKERGRNLHLMGLLSDGGVHSHIDHLFALLDLVRGQGLDRVFVHAFLDGRDVPPDNAREYIESLEDKIKADSVGQIATVMGRYYAMDRDNRWDRTERAYRAMVMGEGIKASTAATAVGQSYERGDTDEFMEPTVLVDSGGVPLGKVEKGDSIIFYNFRADRARQITRAFVDGDFKAFNRPTGYLDPNFVCMTQYDKDIDAPIAFPPVNLRNTLGEVLAGHGKKQLRVAETEKYAHVTFFFNGGVEKENKGEDRILVPSPKVATYDLKPEMSAFLVTDKVIKAIEEGAHDVIIVNYANPDMVGHTGIMEAAKISVETVDKCLGLIMDEVKCRGGILLLTSDHGNVESIVDEKGAPHTAHTLNPVPFVLFGDDLINKDLRDGGSLKDIAVTLLSLMDIPVPREMTGENLIIS